LTLGKRSIVQPLTNSEVTRAEGRLGIALPGLYRKLLVEIGHGIYGQKKECPSNTTKEIYHPESVRKLYEAFFEDQSALFSPYFPFGCDNEKQELWIIDATREKAASIWHETHPDDWSEERWMSYEDWVAAYLHDKTA
jgi:hypothetical protein